LLTKNINNYCFDNNIKRYIEPFVGAGSVLFDVLDKFELDEVIISDSNQNHCINMTMVK